MNFKIKNTLILFTIMTFLSACNMDRNTEGNQSQENLNRQALHNTKNIAYRNENKDEDSNIQENYYKDVKGKTGEDLKIILNRIISNQKTITYNEVWDALKKLMKILKTKIMSYFFMLDALSLKIQMVLVMTVGIVNMFGHSPILIMINKLEQIYTT
ncbi:hypothetical protein AX282_21255 [Bacillus spizizenii]|nr:hypothetical protein AX282_21255 [Bacillus spizizenii]